MSKVPAISEVLRDLVPKADIAQLPPRVREVIRVQENSGEILVKLIQLCVTAIWALLYFLAPKSDTMLAPVPFALAAYMVLHLVGLAWVLRRGLPDWAVYLSVMLDIAMLYLLIWSFHIQYEQPPPFYLKAPTMLYIFILIAMRALRFRARFVLAAGFAAAAGWLFLTAYAVDFGAAPSVLTRDYVQYLTSNSVLLGAEIDKIIAILMVAFIIALVQMRARRLLVEAAREGEAARDLSRYFDAAVARRIRSSDHAAVSGEGVRRDAAVMFVDIRGFSALSDTLDAAQVVELLTAYEKRIVPIILRNGGIIDKYLGDGIMATFGAVAETATYAADALRAMDEIVAETATWSKLKAFSRLQPGSVNAAAVCGPVVFGTLGDDNRLEFTTIGASVNLAAKLEKYNKVAGSAALTDRATYVRAVDQGYQPAEEVESVSRSLEPGAAALDLVILHR